MSGNGLTEHTGTVQPEALPSPSELVSLESAAAPIPSRLSASADSEIFTLQPYLSTRESGCQILPDGDFCIGMDGGAAQAWAAYKIPSLCFAYEPRRITIERGSINKVAEGGVCLAWANRDSQRWELSAPFFRDGAQTVAFLDLPPTESVNAEHGDYQRDDFIFVVLALGETRACIRGLEVEALPRVPNSTGLLSARQYNNEPGVRLNWTVSLAFQKSASATYELKAEVQRSASPDALDMDWSTIATPKVYTGSREYAHVDQPAADQTWYYRVRIVRDELPGPWSNVASAAWTLSGTPYLEPVTGLRMYGTKMSGEPANLKWDAHLLADGYEIQQRVFPYGGGLPSPWDTIRIAQYQQSTVCDLKLLTELQEPQLLQYRVRPMLGGIGGQYWSRFEYLQVPQALNFRATYSIQDRTITFRWDAQSWADGYELYNVVEGSYGRSDLVASLDNATFSHAVDFDTYRLDQNFYLYARQGECLSYRPQVLSWDNVVTDAPYHD
ncbi:hypothetical protein IT575_05935 [bacterium]|nr:hypothetical protein [bacterium]